MGFWTEVETVFAPRCEYASEWSNVLMLKSLEIDSLLEQPQLGSRVMAVSSTSSWLYVSEISPLDYRTLVTLFLLNIAHEFIK